MGRAKARSGAPAALDVSLLSFRSETPRRRNGEPAPESAAAPAGQRWLLGPIAAAALRRDAIFRRSLVAADVFAACCGLLAMIADGHHLGLTYTSWLLPLAGVLVAKLLRLYDRDELVFHKATLDEAPYLLYLGSLLSLTVVFLHELLVSGPVDRLAIGTFWATFTVLVLCTRSVARTISKRVAPPERCIIAGPAGARRRMAEKIFTSQVGIRVVGYLPLEEERCREDRREAPRSEATDRRTRQLTIHDLAVLAGEREAHRLLVIPGSADSDTMAKTISEANRAGVKVSILPRMFEAVGSSVEFDHFEGMTVLGVRRFGLSRSSRFLKRAMDLVLAAVGLVVTAPLFALIAVAIRFDSPGPIFFRQMRMGRGDACFEMLKFRSMVDGADAQRERLLAHNESDGLFKLRNDPRVTRVGRFLRSTHLDELPQLINVLRGEMSLVGPRPLILEEDGTIEGHYRGRLEMAPGITGPWQLLGPVRVPLREMLNMDYLYGANWSLWTDIKVLLRTLAHVLRRDGM